MRKKYLKFLKAFGQERVRFNEPLARHTTFRIGGPADMYIEVKSAAEMKKAVRLARESDIPLFVLGSGANILVADTGFRGLVIRSGIKTLKILGKIPAKVRVKAEGEDSRYKDYQKDFLSFSDLDYKDPAFDTRILVGSGVSLATLIEWSLKHGLTGLEWFSGIPASVGGAIYSNVHGGKRLLLSRVDRIHLLKREGLKKVVKKEYLKAKYDDTILQKTGEIVVEAEFLLSSKGDMKKAKRVAKTWRERKAAVQPQTNCAGCIFKNLTEKERQEHGWPTNSVGYIFDRVLGWKGIFGVGKAVISERHGNFIVNKGGATARDVISLMQKMQSEVRNRYGINLRAEIFFVGF